MSAMTPKPEKGFTLIEMMVALAIGLVITLAVTKAYLSGLGTQQAQTDLSRVQEASRFAFDLLGTSLRKAGYKNPLAPGLGSCDGSKAPGAGICDAPNSIPRLVVSNGPSTINPAAANLSGTTVTVLNGSDVIRVRYYGEGLAYAPFTADGSVVDCLGNAVPTNTLVEDTFFIAADAGNDNEPALFCYTSNTPGSGNVALVPGVESMQFLYGEDSNSGDCYGTVDRYVTAANLSNVNNVHSIIVSIVSRTKETTGIDRSARPAINHFGTSYAASNVAPTGDAGSVFAVPTDGRTRQQFSTTIALRNLCPL